MFVDSFVNLVAVSDKVALGIASTHAVSLEKFIESVKVRGFMKAQWATCEGFVVADFHRVVANEKEGNATAVGEDLKNVNTIKYCKICTIFGLFVRLLTNMTQTLHLAVFSRINLEVFQMSFTFEVAFAIIDWQRFQIVVCGYNFRRDEDVVGCQKEYLVEFFSFKEN
jgi:hypothetical protein